MMQRNVLCDCAGESVDSLRDRPDPDRMCNAACFYMRVIERELFLPCV